MDSRPVGVAMLGYGAIADLHALALRQSAANLVYVAGPNLAEAESFASRHGFERAGDDIEAAICADGVGVVVIASPSQVHADQARKALEAGRHVLAEIPLALTLDEGVRLVALAETQGLRLGVCHTLRFAEPFRLVQAALGTAGVSPSHVAARWMQRRHENVGWTGRQRSWIDNLLWHHGGHVIDMSLALLRSSVLKVGGAVGTRFSKSGDPMDCSIALQTETGGVATIALSYNSLINASDYIVVAGDETYVIEPGRVRCKDGVIFEGDPAAIEVAAINAQDASFIEAVREGTGFGSEGRSVLPTLRVQQEVASANPSS